MSTGIAEYSTRSADLLNVARRFQGSLGNDAAARRASEDLLRVTKQNATEGVSLGFAAQPGVRPPPATDLLAASLYDLQAGNLLVAAGLRREVADVKAAPDLLLQTQRHIESTRDMLLGSGPLPSGFDAVLNMSSATRDSAVGSFRSYSDKLLGEIVSDVRKTVLLALDKIGGLNAGELGDVLGRLGKSVPFVAEVGRLVRRGVEMIKNAIEALARLFGEDALEKMRDAVSEVWKGVTEEVFPRLLGVSSVKAHIEEILAMPARGKAAIDQATNTLAPLGQSFARDIRLLGAIIAAIGVAGALLGLLSVTGPWLVAGLGVAYATTIAAVFLIGGEYTGERPLLGRKGGVKQIAQRIPAS